MLCWNAEFLNYELKTINFGNTFIYFNFNSSLYLDYLSLSNNYVTR